MFPACLLNFSDTPTLSLLIGARPDFALEAIICGGWGMCVFVCSLAFFFNDRLQMQEKRVTGKGQERVRRARPHRR
jgi:hypothetical protein